MQSIYTYSLANMAMATEYLETVDRKDLDTFCVFVNCEKDLSQVEEEIPEVTRISVVSTVDRVLRGWRVYSARNRKLSRKADRYKQAIEKRLLTPGMDDEEFARNTGIPVLLATTICAMFGIN